MEKRTVCYDNDLHIEAYRLEGIVQKFPNHFHEYYVLGFMEKGCRRLSCKNVEYTVSAGDLVLFNPLENHTCVQIDNKAMDYRCLNLSPEIVQKIALDITGTEYLPHFTQTVIRGSEAVFPLKELHQMIMDGYTDFKKEETLYFLIEQLNFSYGETQQNMGALAVSPEIKLACEYMEKNYSNAISLDDLSNLSGINKYTLLRNFTKQRGITPYQYLETIRVNSAKKMLEEGTEPIDAAILCGFSDQSHFTKYFKNFIGLTPKQYKGIFENNGGKRFER